MRHFGTCRTILTISFFLALCACSLFGSPLAGETLTYSDLVDKMTDMEALSLLPREGEQCAQWSSWNRKARYDAATDKYIDWDMNGDNSGHIRKEGDSIVMGEMEGPGCIWRIWSAQPQNGHVKIYLDGQEAPTIDQPFKSMFDGSRAPFNYPALNYQASQGWNCFVPIPYQKSCKIVAEKGWGGFYQFTYSSFPEGTKILTFKTDLSEEDAAALERVNAQLLNGLGQKPRKNIRVISTCEDTVRIKPGETARVADIQGPKAITAIRIQFDCGKNGAEQAEILRQTAIQIKWDNESSPSVWAPLGDFFGTAPGVNYYATLPMGMTRDGFYCYWHMPFSERAEIDIINDSDTEIALDFSADCSELTLPVSDYGRFHAKWHRDVFLPEDPDRATDWPE